MPYTHASETVIAAAQATKSRIERIEIDTPSNDAGDALVGLYSVRVTLSKFDSAGQKIPNKQVTFALSGADVISLISEATLAGETIGAAIQRVTYTRAATAGAAPGGGTVT